MRKIAIEEAIFFEKLGPVRNKWVERNDMPGTIDLELYMGTIMPRMIAPFDKVRLPEMNAAGVDIQVLSLGAPGVQGCEDAREALTLSIESNDLIYEKMKAYPGRFGGFAAVPTQDPEAAAKELERCVTKLGFCGAMVQGRTEDKYLDDPSYDVLWEAAQALNVPISLHVMDTDVRKMQIFEGCYSLLGPGWSWNLESATHVLRIIMNGVFERFPKAQVICGHMGEGLPYYLGRIDEGFMTFCGHLEQKLTRLPSAYFPTNVYITTSGRYYPPAMRCAIDAVGVDRVLFATDWPFLLLDEAIELVENCSLSREEKESIFHINAERLLNIAP